MQAPLVKSPIIANISLLSMNCLTRSELSFWSPLESFTINCIFLPFTPPEAFILSAAICVAISNPLPYSALTPVNGANTPIVNVSPTTVFSEPPQLTKIPKTINKITDKKYLYIFFILLTPKYYLWKCNLQLEQPLAIVSVKSNFNPIASAIPLSPSIAISHSLSQVSSSKPNFFQALIKAQ